MLGRFAVPAGYLHRVNEELGPFVDADQFWPLTVMVSTSLLRDLGRIREFEQESDGFRVEAIELPPLGVADIGRVMQVTSSGWESFFEWALDDTRVSLEAVAEVGGYAKVRTGDLVASAIPEAKSLADFILSCHEMRLPFKATGGLHHPLRSIRELTGKARSQLATVHGFLNVAVGAALLTNGQICHQELVDVLEETEATAFRFRNDSLSWRERVVSLEQLQCSRGFFRSLGSCSFAEPVDGLSELGDARLRCTKS